MTLCLLYVDDDDSDDRLRMAVFMRSLSVFIDAGYFMSEILAVVADCSSMFTVDCSTVV